MPPPLQEKAHPLCFGLLLRRPAADDRWQPCFAVLWPGMLYIYKPHKVKPGSRKQPPECFSNLNTSPASKDHIWPDTVVEVVELDMMAAKKTKDQASYFQFALRAAQRSRDGKTEEGDDGTPIERITMYACSTRHDMMMWTENMEAGIALNQKEMGVFLGAKTTNKKIELLGATADYRAQMDQPALVHSIKMGRKTAFLTAKELKRQCYSIHSDTARPKVPATSLQLMVSFMCCCYHRDTYVSLSMR
jgi:hypothetical protein